MVGVGGGGKGMYWLGCVTFRGSVVAGTGMADVFFENRGIEEEMKEGRDGGREGGRRKGEREKEI